MAETCPCVAIIRRLVEARSVVAADSGGPCSLMMGAVVRELGIELDSGKLGAIESLSVVWSQGGGCWITVYWKVVFRGTRLVLVIAVLFAGSSVVLATFWLGVVSDMLTNSEPSSISTSTLVVSFRPPRFLLRKGVFCLSTASAWYGVRPLFIWPAFS